MGGAASVISPQIEELNQYVLAEKYKDFADENAQRWIGVATLVGRSDDGRTDSKDVHVFKERDPDRKTESALGLVKFFTDGDFEANKLVSFLLNGVLDYLQGMDHDESFHYFENEDESDKAIEAIFEGILPPVHVKWTEWESLRTHSQLAFQGLGQYLLTMAKKDRAEVTVPENAVYEIDLSEWAHYEVRKGLERYGTISYFGEDRLPVGIWWCSKNKLVLPADEDYQHVAMLSRVTLATRITLREHLSEVHWTVSNGLLLATERYLGTEHPIRRLTKPHTFHAAEVNAASAQTLAPVKGLAWRTFGFTEDSWATVMTNQVKAFKYHTLEEHFVQSGLPDDMRQTMPLYKDGLELYQIFERYVRKYIDIFYADDNAVSADGELNEYWNDFSTQIPENVYGLPALTKESLIAQLTHSIFHVTAFHQYVGANIEYLMHPNSMSGVLPKKSNKSTIQASFYVLVLMALTQTKQPLLINDWTKIHEYLKGRNDLHYDQVIGAVNEWQEALVAYNGVIEQRNRERDLKGDQNFVAMYPKIMDCSVSV